MPNDTNKYIIGAVAGDIIGSVYEFQNIKATVFQLFSPASNFTDDSVLTFATMDSLINKTGYEKSYLDYGRKYPDAGYGGRFYYWLFGNNPVPYNSWGNGSAMRVSPMGWAFDSLEEVLLQAKGSAEVTHNHPEGIKGAQAAAAAVFMARTGKSKDEIKIYISKNFGYNLNRTIKEIRPSYQFDESCQGSVPEAIIAFLESVNYEDAIRLAVSIGGDSDTIACVVGGIAEAFYKEIPDYIRENVLSILPNELKDILKIFSSKYNDS
jgi:ADP-ribosylglycohydrolase